ncbi:DUF1540 domain-containing protein [Clostridium thermobutyricum]|uniref:DUF1540 domain-containing protein n=1 Tax=Clostridium thermobutyricum TaxID=29372 RepID=UPI003F51FD4E
MINCTVLNCSHNANGNCKANRVDIGGALANEASATCCGSFLDNKHYGDLTNSTNRFTGEPALVCSAETCEHNKNKLCSLSSITVKTNTDTKIYTETFCSNFDK